MTLRDVGRLPPAVRELGLGVVYWLAFLLVLEPGNLMRAIRAGSEPHWGIEIPRIVAANLLGALSAPLLFALVRRWPVEGKAWRRNAVILAASCALISAALIAVSTVLAHWLFVPKQHSLAGEFVGNFASNWLLLVFSLAGFLAIVHALGFFGRMRAYELAAAAIENAPGYLTQIPVRARGRITLLEFATVDWIEAQGNYLALHVGPAAHLIRESIARLEARLDPAEFARIHRSTIVAVDRIANITPLGAGDAALHLKDGTELRLSRNFRERLRSGMLQ
ncbi:MAG: LytTR family DNA-binding domain-containing protein [Rhizomicrobium sp.]